MSGRLIRYPKITTISDKRTYGLGRMVLTHQLTKNIHIFAKNPHLFGLDIGKINIRGDILETMSHLKIKVFSSIETKKKGVFSSFLLLHEVEYKMAWRLVRRRHGGRTVVGELGVLNILLKAGGQSFCGAI